MSALYLTPRQRCDIECLLNGAFAPLDGFNDQVTYESILRHRRLPNGDVWPMPITLDITHERAHTLFQGDTLHLHDQEGLHIANLLVTALWEPDKTIEALAVFGTLDDTHPGVHYLWHETAAVYVGGPLEKIALPNHYDFTDLRLTPAQLKQQFQQQGIEKVVAFQTRNPLHRAHQALTWRAAQECGAHLLLHPVVGQTKPGDIDHYTRVRCYQHVFTTYPAGSATLSLLPLAMRMAGPIEALWHALIRKNYGCTHFIVGRDHAGPGKDRRGQDFYTPYAAQDFVQEYAKDIGIHIVPFQELVYIKERDTYIPENEKQPQESALKISGTELRRRLKSGEEIPEWFSYPSVVHELRKTFPPRHRQGLVIFFTGLSGAGKSTIAQALLIKLMELTDRSVSLLDGDVVRKTLSSELGFSREHRDLNIIRLGYVATEIAKHGGIAICAPIAPYAQTRRTVRRHVSEVGVFIEVYVSTALAVCEHRDRKGLYRQARQGKIKEFTGIDDPYEIPENAEIVIDTAHYSIQEEVGLILARLSEMGYVSLDKSASPS